MPRVLADLHIHSRFSFSTSWSLAPGCLHKWAGLKGLGLLGTGDMVHPAWLKELEESLIMGDDGFYGLKGQAGGPRFVPTGEISCVYKHLGRTRKVHLLFIAPDLEAAGRLARGLAKHAKLDIDGRPLLTISARDALETALEADDRIEAVPAHVWTPWFSLFGSKSGYDDLTECFGDLSGRITALETGLSSDPAMNRLVSKLDRYALISSSDAHSPEKLGREATMLEGPLDFAALKRALRGGPELLGTVEFFPEEGKYHLDGHRDCGPAMTPKETLEAGGLCPVCGKPVTLGVLSRVCQLADREAPPESLMLPDHHIVPLLSLVSQALGARDKTRGVKATYSRLILELGGELPILIDASISDITALAGPLLARGIEKMRAGEVSLSGGYDGDYGEAVVITEQDRLDFAGSEPVLWEPPKKRGRPPKEKDPEDSKKDSPPKKLGRPPKKMNAKTLDEYLAWMREEPDGPAWPTKISGRKTPKKRSPGPAKRKSPGEDPSSPVKPQSRENVPSPSIEPQSRDNLPSSSLEPEGRERESLSSPALAASDSFPAPKIPDKAPAPSVKRRASTSGILSGLSDEQKLAATWEEGDLLVSAGPGTGKSLLLARRAAHLASKGEGPIFVAALSATGAALLRSALDQFEPGRRAQSGTLQSLAYSKLSDLRPELKLIGSAQRLALTQEAAAPFSINPKILEALVANAKTGLRPLESISQEGFEGSERAAEAALRYQSLLDKESLMDSSDLIPKALSLGLDWRYEWVLADEAEDYSLSQIKLLSALAPAGRLAAAGDPGQSLYGRLGAAADPFGELEKLRSGIKYLSFSLNYRSAPAICQAAEAARGDGPPIIAARRHPLVPIERASFERPGDEAAWVAKRVAEYLKGSAQEGGLRYEGDLIPLLDPGQIAVLFRLRRQGAEIARALDRAGLPWQMAGDHPLEEDLSPSSGKVSLMPMRAAKGLEFRLLFLTGLEDGLIPLKIPSISAQTPSEAEERRLFYVALARAMDKICVSKSFSRSISGVKLSGGPSPFWSLLTQKIAIDRLGAEAARSKGPQSGGSQSGGREP
ncbi:MAG: UvrD-helicase domain-containing protein [Deltaproteobacteria bacterium]|jgi:uncharacterized protein (TIGR00375 family)|nr:UvrD-helicase domain-containing protein [Deltaproteobacteria bacterium]